MRDERTPKDFWVEARLGLQTIWLLGLQELLHDLSPRDEENQYGCQIHPFSFLKFSFTKKR